MADFTKYLTKEGDRWDLIAYRAYGKVDEAQSLISANPTVPIYDVFPSGIEIKVPVLDAPEVNTNLLPPWKR